MAKCFVGANGGGKVTVSGLAANKTLKGTTVTVKQGAKTVASVAGSIPSKAAATYTPKTTNQTIAAGQYLSGTQTIKGDSNLTAANILTGKTIFGVAGSVPKLLCIGGYIHNSGMRLNAISNISIAGFTGGTLAPGTVRSVNTSNISFTAPSSGRKVGYMAYMATMTVEPESFSKGETVQARWESGAGGGGMITIEFD